MTVFLSVCRFITLVKCVKIHLGEIGLYQNQLSEYLHLRLTTIETYNSDTRRLSLTVNAAFRICPVYGDIFGY